MFDLDNEGVAPDPGMVRNSLQDPQDQSYLDDLVEYPLVFPSNARHYAEILAEIRKKRRALVYADKLIRASASGVPEDIDRILEEISGKQEEEQEVTWIDGYDIIQDPVEPVEYLVDRLIPLRGAGTIDGPPDSGKSSLVLNLAVHIANGGGPWFGSETVGGQVVVLGGEKSTRTAWRRDFERLGKPRQREQFLIPTISKPLWMWNRREGKWDRSIDYGKILRNLKQIKPVLVIGDTIMRLAGGMNVLDIGQQALLGLELEDFAQEANCFFLVIGHTNQASSRESLHWRLHYIARAGGNGLPGILRFCMGVALLGKDDVKSTIGFTEEDLTYRRILAVAVSKGNEMPPARWTQNNPGFFELMPSGELMMLDKSGHSAISKTENRRNKKGMEEPIEQKKGVESGEYKEYAYDDF